MCKACLLVEVTRQTLFYSTLILYTTDKQDKQTPEGIKSIQVELCASGADDLVIQGHIIKY